MARVEITKNSWLNIAELLEADDGSGQVFWDTPDFIDIIPQEDDTFITVDSEYAGNLDLIASDFYDDPDLWWPIALANNIEIWPTDVRLNMELRIPSRAYIDDLLGRGEQK